MSLATTELLEAVRALPDVWLAAFARGLDDEALLHLVRGVFLASAEPPRPAIAPIRKAPPAKAKAKSGKAPRLGKVSDEITEKVAKIVVGADGGVSSGDVAKKIGTSATTAKRALDRLIAEGRCFMAGAGRSTRYAVDQESADEASRSLSA